MEYHLLYSEFPAFPAHSSMHLLGDPSEENFLIVPAKEAPVTPAIDFQPPPPIDHSDFALLVAK